MKPLLDAQALETKPDGGCDGGHYAEDDLSEREIEVLSAVAQGKSNKIIASQLFITEPTAKAHMKSIMLKLGLRIERTPSALRRLVVT